MTIKTFFAGMAVLALLLLNGCSARATPVMEETGVLELPYTVQSLAWHPDGRLLAVGYFMRDVVEVWDVHTKKPVFSVPSKRWVGNHSGQDLLFSPDGKYLIVQDYQDVKHGELKVPESIDEAAEIAARNDKDRYVLARLWDVVQRREVAQIKGPGTRRIGATSRAMCVLANGSTLAVLRATGVAVYGLPSGALESELDLAHPFNDRPQVGRSYETMSCNPVRDEVSLGALQFFRDAEKFGLTNWTGATAIVIADLERNAIKKVLFSATPLNGVAYSADGSKLVSFGMSPIRVWDANRDFAALGEIENPPEWLWLNQRGMKVDMLQPPPNIPRGNAGKLVPVAGTDLMFGLSGDLYLWSLTERRAIVHLPAFPDVLRIAAHQASDTFAVVDDRLIHIYKLNRSALSALRK
jgi:hypothetical protein